MDKWIVFKQILEDDYRALCNSGESWETQASIIKAYIDLMKDLEAEDDDRGTSA